MDPYIIEIEKKLKWFNVWLWKKSSSVTLYKLTFQVFGLVFSTKIVKSVFFKNGKYIGTICWIFAYKVIHMQFDEQVLVVFFKFDSIIVSIKLQH